MAKNRRKEGDDRNGRFESSDDSLGKLIQLHHVSLAGAFIVCGILVVIGLGVVAFALTRHPFSLIFLLVGVFFVVTAITLLGTSLVNVGRRLELRKRGVRFVESGSVAELFWDEIAEIEVKRADNTYMGLVSVHKQSSDAVSPSGPLTKTEWNVTIHTNDGRRIRLTSTFLRIVSDPKKLISQLRLRAGVP